MPGFFVSRRWLVAGRAGDALGFRQRLRAGQDLRSKPTARQIVPVDENAGTAAAANLEAAAIGHCLMLFDRDGFGHGEGYAARTCTEQLILFLCLSKPFSFAVCADFAERPNSRKTL
ncbi:hypothetical protein [Bradyrhizobium sp. CCBAU 11434]|uniref:hypothetical protein n=1 Tax=Bradyrhizobium sp. CCBAU 11434 TaxID=1630885 RepID=UPI0023059ED7|nr:hypothetical protein [Bradyrhizobium sp. CCBAU 11434]